MQVLPDLMWNLCGWAEARQAGTACVITAYACEAASAAAISAAVELNDAAAGPEAGPSEILSRVASPRQ